MEDRCLKCGSIMVESAHGQPICYAQEYGIENACGILEELKDLRQLAQDLLDKELCHLDHHGYCQAHGWLKDTTCPMKRIRDKYGE